MRVVGLDIGNGHLKAHEGTSTVVFPSIAGPALTISFRSQLADAHPGDLKVEAGGRSWFVGDLALRQSPHPVAARGQERGPEILRALLLGALFRLAVPDGQRLRVITGLPIEWYRTDEIAHLRRALEGLHEGVVNGAPRRWQVEG